MSHNTCSVSEENCIDPATSLGMCGKHYARAKRHGSPLVAHRFPERTCVICGQTWQPVRAASITCSPKCRGQLPDSKATKNASRRVANNPVQRRLNLRQNLIRYGITPERLDEMVATQANRCAICGAEPDLNGIKAASRLHVDHDHVTGKVRDLLCNRCNQGIGYFKDDPDLFAAAADYIRRHRESA